MVMVIGSVRRWLARMGLVALLAGFNSMPAWAGGYWSGVARALPVSPLGNTVAVSCHNCYGNTDAATQAQVALALGREFDLIEFDLTLHTDGQVSIEHAGSQEATRGTLAQALANTALRRSDRLLFLEIKENFRTAEASDALMLAVLRALRDQGYAAPGRPAVLRAFIDANNRHQHLVRAKAMLAATEFATIRDHVRFHALIDSDVHNAIKLTHSLGLHGVELEHRIGNLFGALAQARQLGLGVGVYTLPASMGEVLLSALREDVDFITTEHDRSATAQLNSARALAQERNSLLHLNTAAQAGYPLAYRRGNSQAFLVGQSNGTPDFGHPSTASDEDQGATSLLLHGAQSITAWDGSNAAGGGFLVTAVVGFNDLASGATGAIIAKSDSGGFALEQAGSDLRFGVYVAGSYRYASVPLSTFNSSDTYFIVGAYDGNGAVRLWANNTERSASAPVKGGVGLNHSPIVIGADPQGATERRFYFNGRIQQVMVQRWRDHAAPPAQGRRCALRLPACLLRD